jgi:hypothetical protein
MSNKKANLTIREAAREFDKSEVRIRRMIKEDRVEAQLVEVQQGEHTFQRYEITRASLEKYENEKGRKADGKKAYIFRATPEQLAKLQKLAKDNEIAVTFEPRYQPKKKS